jgi:hypothetical protein
MGKQRRRSSCFQLSANPANLVQPTFLVDARVRYITDSLSTDIDQDVALRSSYIVFSQNINPCKMSSSANTRPLKEDNPSFVLRGIHDTYYEDVSRIDP